MTPPPSRPLSTDPFHSLPLEILQLIRHYTLTQKCWCPAWDGFWTVEAWKAYWPRGKPLRPMDIHLANVSATWLRLVLTEKYRKIGISFTVHRLLETMDRLPYVAENILHATTCLHFGAGFDVGIYDPPFDIRMEAFWFDFPEDDAIPSKMTPAVKLMDRVFVDRRRLVKARGECLVSHYRIARGNDGYDSTPEFHEVGCPSCQEIVERDPSERLEDLCQYCHIKATNPSQIPWQMPLEEYPPAVRELDGGPFWVDPWAETGDPMRLSSGSLGKGPIDGLASWEDWHRLTAEVIKRCKPAEFTWDACCHSVPQIIIDALTSHDSLKMFSCWSRTAEDYCDPESYVCATYRPIVARCESIELATYAYASPAIEATPEHEVIIELLLHAKQLKHLHLGSGDGPVSMDGRLVPLFSTLHTLHVCAWTDGPVPPRQAAMASLRSVLLEKATSRSPADLRLTVKDVLEVAADDALQPVAEDLQIHAEEIAERWNASDRGPASTDPHATRLQSSYGMLSTEWWPKT